MRGALTDLKHLGGLTMNTRATLRDKLVAFSFLGFLAFLLVFIVLITVFPCMITWNQACVEKALAPHLAKYASMAGLPEAQGNGYIVGRLVVVNVGEPFFDSGGRLLYEPATLNSEVHFGASDHANRPDEVGTVVLLRWGKRPVKTYARGVVAYVITCEVLVIDTSRQAIVDRGMAEGSEPHDHDAIVRARSEAGLEARVKALRKYGLLGSIPTTDVSLSLKSLPRR